MAQRQPTSHVTRTRLSRSKVKVTRPLYSLCVGASGSCSGGRGNVLAVNCCYVAVCSAARGPAAPTGEERGGGISWRPPAYSLSCVYVIFSLYVRELVVLVQLSVVAKRFARKTPLRTLIRGMEIISRKPRLKRMFLCIFFSFCLLMLLCVPLPPGTRQCIFHTLMARQCVQKMSLNTSQPAVSHRDVQKLAMDISSTHSDLSNVGQIVHSVISVLLCFGT